MRKLNLVKILFLFIITFVFCTLVACDDQTIETKEYKITFVEANKTSDVTLKENSKITFPTPESVTDKKFKGWSLSRDGEIIDASNYLSKDKDLTFYAVYEDDKQIEDTTEYTITFIEKNDLSSSAKLKENDKVVFPEAKKVEGFTFKGWSLVKDGELVDTTNYVVGKADLKFYAVYEASKPVTLEPIITPLVIHWVIGSPEAKVTALVDLQGADSENIICKVNEDTLERYVDFDLEEGEFTLYGQFLDKKATELGTYTVFITSLQGEAFFDIYVVDSVLCEGSTIPTTTKKGINMSPVPEITLTTPIADAPELLITEVRGHTTLYTYVEVFNNTMEEYNLKGHRIIYSDISDAKSIVNDVNGSFVEPLGMSASAYIYKDMKIPALQKAIIWLVTTYPWEVVKDGDNRYVKETETAKEGLFDWEGGELKLSTFKNTYRIDDDTLVYAIRFQNMLFNNTYNYDSTTGFGGPVAKSGDNLIKQFNFATNNRSLQIQKLDQDTHFTTTIVNDLENGIAPEGSAYYKYEAGIINPEEEVYASGAMDKSVIKMYGTRECINGLYVRKVYYNSSDEKVGYALDTSGCLDMYNALASGTGREYTISSLKEVAKAIVTVIFYPSVGTEAMEKWSALVSCEYMVPEKGSIIMRFIPRQVGAKDAYKAWYEASGDPEALINAKLSGVAKEITEVLADKDLVVPVESVYPTEYLKSGYNTSNKVCWFNFYETEPSK